MKIPYEIKDGEIKINEKRIKKPGFIKDEKSNNLTPALFIDTFYLNACQIIFIKPNRISLLLNTAKRELDFSHNIYIEEIKPYIIPYTGIAFQEENLLKLYDYFEHIQVSIVAIYSAIEGVVNALIPEDYEYKTIKKGTLSQNKKDIEKNITTGEKLNEIIPEILKIGKPKNLKYYNLFEELISIRDSIVHPKTVNEDPSDLELNINRKLLDPNIFKIVQSGFSIIEYLCNNSKPNDKIPIGFGSMEMNEIIKSGMVGFFDSETPIQTATIINKLKTKNHLNSEYEFHRIMFEAREEKDLSKRLELYSNAAKIKPNDKKLLLIWAFNL